MTKSTNKAKVTDLPSALDRADEIEKLANEKRVAVFLDYDGTLTPIVERPEDATLADKTRQAVRKLAEQCTVAVISGRDLKDVQQLVGVKNIFFAGSHGFDIAGPDDWQLQSEKGSKFLPALGEAEQELRARLQGIQGSLVERKKFSIAVHFRQVADDRVEQVEHIVDRVLNDHKGLRKGFGKKVFELQPEIDWHKGKALQWLLEALDLNDTDVLPIYLGDDVTDEDAFEVLRDRGIGIFVKGEGGPHETAARYTLEDPDEVREFLLALAEVEKLKS